MKRFAAFWTVACLVGWAAVAPAPGAPSIHLVEEERITLTFRPLTAETVEHGGEGFSLEVREAKPTETTVRVLWPDPEAPARLRLRASRTLSAAGQIVRLGAELRRPDGSLETRSTREILFSSDEVTALFEVARRGERALIFAVEGELTRETTYTARPVIGAPVQFQLDVEWLERGDAQTLETNLLHTFLGQEVGYAFRLGEVGEAESADVRLRPSRLLGDTLRIDVEITATLPDPDGGVALVSRKETWLSTNGVASSLSLAEGEPPTGFRFRVTPRF